MAEPAPWDLDWTGVSVDETPPDAPKGPALTPEQQKGMKQLANDEILTAIKKARAQVNGWSTGLAGQGLSNLGGTDARALMGALGTIASRLTVDKLAEMKSASPTGASGLGSLTEKEGQLLRDSVAGIDQFQDAETLLQSLDAVELHYRNMKALMDGKDYRAPDVQKQYGIVLDGNGNFLNEDSRKAASALQPRVAGPGATSTDVQVPPGMQRELAGYLRARKTLDPQDFAAFYGDLNRRYNFGSNPDPQVIQNFVDNHNKGIPFGGITPSESRPLSAIEQGVNNAANSIPGAYAVGAADALTLGSLDSLSGNPELTRGGMEAVSQQGGGVPYALGQFSGATLGMLGAGRAVGTGARATLGADTAYGAAYGAGSNDQDRFTGALTGGAAALGGSWLGSKIANGVTGAMRGVTDPNVVTLRNAGVPMTWGQMLGGAAKSAEERRMSNPFAGDLIRQRQMDGLRGFNRAAFNEVGDKLAMPIQDIGQRGIAQVQDAVGNLYDQAHSGMQFVPDAPFAQTMGNIQRTQAGNGILNPEQLQQVAKNVKMNVGGRIRGGGIFGKSFKKAMSQMRSDAANMDPAVGSAVKEYRDAILDAARRQSDPNAVSLLNRADEAYPAVKTLEAAVGAARNQGESLFTPAQLGNTAYMGTKKFSGVGAAARGDVPFNTLQQAAVDVLPNRVPNSGTAERTIENSLLGNLVSRAKALPLKALYAPENQTILQKLLMDRPDIVRAIGSDGRVRGLLGSISAPLAITYQGN